MLRYKTKTPHVSVLSCPDNKNSVICDKFYELLTVNGQKCRKAFDVKLVKTRIKMIYEAITEKASISLGHCQDWKALHNNKVTS